jgi:hypothetical protein
VVLAVPATVVATSDVAAAAVLALGLAPAACVPLPASRRARVRPAMLGVWSAASLLVGAVLALWPPLAVVGVFVFAVAASRAAVGHPFGALALSLCLPLVGVGLSFSDLRTAAALAAAMVVGSGYAFAVSLAWPARKAPPREPETPYASPGAAVLVPFGYRAGIAAAICAAVGFALDLEHVGWATGAALLVMRPVREVQEARSVGRVVDVVLGAAAAIALITADLPGWVVAAAVGAAVVGLTATAGSRWYVMPAFTTFLVFLLMLAASPEQAQSRFWERLLETLFGVGVAVAVGLLAPAWARSRGDRRAV